MAFWAFRGDRGTQKTTITSSTDETTIVSAYEESDGKDVLCDLYGLIIANTSATICDVTIKDDTAGTTRFKLTIPADDTRGFIVPKESAHQQAVANKPWTATCSASVASIEITALFVKNS
jgi:hypothetical protein